MTSSNGANNMGAATSPAPAGSAAAMVQHGGQVLLNWKPSDFSHPKGLDWLTCCFNQGVFDLFVRRLVDGLFSLLCFDRLLLKNPFWVGIRHCYCQSLRQLLSQYFTQSQWRQSLWRFATVNRDCDLLRSGQQLFLVPLIGGRWYIITQ